MDASAQNLAAAKLAAYKKKRKDMAGSGRLIPNTSPTRLKASPGRFPSPSTASSYHQTSPSKIQTSSNANVNNTNVSEIKSLNDTTDSLQPHMMNLTNSNLLKTPTVDFSLMDSLNVATPASVVSIGPFLNSNNVDYERAYMELASEYQRTNLKLEKCKDEIRKLLESRDEFENQVNSRTKLETDRYKEQIRKMTEDRPEFEKQIMNKANELVDQYKEIAKKATDEQMHDRMQMMETVEKQKRLFEEEIMIQSSELVQSLRGKILQLEQQIAIQQEETRKYKYELTRKLGEDKYTIEIEWNKKFEEYRKRKEEEVKEMQEYYMKREQDIRDQTEIQKKEFEFQQKRILEEQIAKFKDMADAKQNLLNEESNRMKREVAEIQRRYEETRIAYENELKTKYEKIVNDYQTMANRAHEKLEGFSQEFQKKELDRLSQVDQDKYQFEKEVVTKANDLIDQYKEMAKLARDELDKERESTAALKLKHAEALDRARINAQDETSERLHIIINQNQQLIEELKLEAQKQREEFLAKELATAKKIEDDKMLFEKSALRKANQLVEEYKRLTFAAEKRADENRRLLNDSKADFEKRLTDEKDKYKQDLKRETDRAISELDRTISSLKQQLEDERERSKLTEYQLRASLQKEKAEYEEKSVRNADELINKFKSATAEAEMKLAEERAINSQKEIALRAEIDALTSSIPVLAQKKADEIISDYQRRSKMSSERLKEDNQEYLAKIEEDIKRERAILQEQKITYEQQLKARYDAVVKEQEEINKKLNESKKFLESQDRDRNLKLEQEKLRLAKYYEKEYQEQLMNLDNQFREKQKQVMEQERRSEDQKQEFMRNYMSSVEIEKSKFEKSVEERYEKLKATLYDEVEKTREELKQREISLIRQMEQDRVKHASELAQKQADFEV